MDSLNFILIHWRPALEILILWFLIYHIMLFFEGTRAIQVLRGIVILLVIFFVFQFFNFSILDWIMTKLFAISVIAIFIIFAPEIRQGLARLGQRNLFGTTLPPEEWDSVLKEVCNASENLSKQRIGALIAIEKNDPLSAYIESGVMVDGKVSSDLLETVFTPKSMLHDGGVVIQFGRLAAAGCIFPLNQHQELSRVFGTRHRAALGLSDETDSLIIVVSEERQDITLVYRGRMYKDLSSEELFTKTREFIKLKKENE
ncbi:MAG: TIGR00159 family protein [Candidatus Omnitrophica bacterium]|nr:TIGR00159 family protein [Candidatus Omnitrophota bacterium]